MIDPASPTHGDSTTTAHDPGIPAGLPEPQSSALRLLAIGPNLGDPSSEALGTVEALVGAGHRVTCIQDPRARDVVEGAGAQLLPDGPAGNPHRQTTACDPSISSARRIFATALGAGGFDALIYEGACFYGKTLADEMGVPAIRLCTGFATSRTIIGDMAAVNTGRGAGSIYRDCAATRLLSWNAHRKGLIEAEDILTEALENLPAASIVYTTESFQMRPETLEGGQFHFVGASVSQRADREEDQGLISFDGLKHPIVQVSLGPLTAGGTASRHELRRTARLYRTCIEAFADQEASVLVCIGAGGDASRLGSLPGNVRVYGGAPELTVLRHADLFVTAGTMGAVNNAMYYGVPTIVIPTTDDQPAIAARVTELGLGAMIPAWELSPQIVRRQAATLLDDVGVRLLLRRMSRDMHSARGAGRAAQEIAALVRCLQTSSLQRTA